MKTMTQTEIEREVLRTLETLDRPEGLPPDPGFYGRVMARLAEQGRPRRAFGAVLRPALLSVLVVLNLGTAAWYLGALGRNDPVQEQMTLKQVLATDLELSSEPDVAFIGERE